VMMVPRPSDIGYFLFLCSICSTLTQIRFISIHCTRNGYI